MYKTYMTLLIIVPADGLVHNGVTRHITESKARHISSNWLRLAVDP